MLAIVLGGCSGEGTTPTTPTTPTFQGVIAMARWDDGTPMFDGALVAGGAISDPDGGGQSYFLDLFPGRSPVTLRRVDTVLTSGIPEVLVDTVSATVIDVMPLPESVVVDPAAPLDVVAGGLHLSLPAGAGAVDGSPVGSPWDLVAFRATEAERSYIPGDQIGIRNDVDLVPIQIVELVYTRGLSGEDEVGMADGQLAPVVIDLPADSPLLTADQEFVDFYGWSPSRGYWVHAGGAPVDVGARTVSFEIAGLGWYAAVIESPERPCVQGRLVADAAPIPGAEIRSFQDGLLGVDRVTSAADGTFCLPVDDGATAAFRVVGLDNSRTAMFTGSGTASGGAALGDVALDRWGDSDGDHTFGGPGGDCDDSDADVGPSLGLQDGSWCGEPL